MGGLVDVVGCRRGQEVGVYLIGCSDSILTEE